MSGVTTIDGTSGIGIAPASASFNFQPFTASTSASAAAAAVTSSLTLNLLPSSNYATISLLASCARQAQQLRHTKHTRRITPRHDGPNREGALFCRSGTWVEILDKRTAEFEAKRNELSRPEYVRGTRLENSRFSILEFISVAFGLVSIRGRESQRYLCMDREGRLYAALQQNYSMECVFMEEMLENYYNLYSSCTYGTPKKPWYIALRKTGRPRKGKNSRKRRKSSHFLVVHFDGDQNNNPSDYAYTGEDGSIHFPKMKISRPDRYGYQTQHSSDQSKPPLPKSLIDILPGTLQQHPPEVPLTRQYTPIEMARWIAAQRRINGGNRKMPLEERHDIRRRRRRKNRLEREERQRQQRRQELEFQRANAYKEQLGK